MLPSHGKRLSDDEDQQNISAGGPPLRQKLIGKYFVETFVQLRLKLLWRQSCETESQRFRVLQEFTADLQVCGKTAATEPAVPPPSLGFLYDWVPAHVGRCLLHDLRFHRLWRLGGAGGIARLIWNRYCYV